MSHSLLNRYFISHWVKVTIGYIGATSWSIRCSILYLNVMFHISLMYYPTWIYCFQIKININIKVYCLWIYHEQVISNLDMLYQLKLRSISYCIVSAYTVSIFCHVQLKLGQLLTLYQYSNTGAWPNPASLYFMHKIKKEQFTKQLVYWNTSMHRSS